MKIAVSGATGLIGSRFVELLKDKYELIGLSGSNRINLTEKDSIHSALKSHNPSILVHFAAKTDVDGCELDKQSDLENLSRYSLLDGKRLDLQNINPLNWKGEKSAFAVNTVGTKNLTDYAKENNIQLIYISTDFVFSGHEDYYTEDSIPDPADWYGQTKYWGEEIVKQTLTDFLVVRLSFPYGHRSEIKKDFVWKIVELLQTRDKITMVSDQVITPTFIDDIVLGLDFLIQSNHNKSSSGIYHLTGSNFYSPYEMGILIADSFSLDKNKIGKVHAGDFYKNRAKRPSISRMKSDKLRDLGFNTKSFEEGLRLISQM